MMLVLWLAWQTNADLDAAVARYNARTRAIIECRSDKPDDVLVCARRAADQYRLPIIELDLSDPKNEPVAAERERLLARTNNCEELSTFLVGCGSAGIGISTAKGVRGIGERPIAP